MVRNFNEKDKQKKQARIKLPENPCNLSPEVLSALRDKVKASLKDGNLPCGIAFRIAQEAGVPKLAVGAITDSLGLRVTNCQIGCFKVEKTFFDGEKAGPPDAAIAVKLQEMKDNNQLTCAGIFELAAQLKLTPMSVANIASQLNLKIQSCQLGCF